MVWDAVIGSGLGKLFGGSSGRSRSRPGRVQREWDALTDRPGQLDSSQGPPRDLADSGIYDEFGNTRALPGSHIALDAQYGANVVSMRRNDRLAAYGGAQAQQALRSGLGNLLAYRPGGAAAMLSPYYQQQAQQHFATALARQQQAPYLLANYDKQVRRSTEEAAQKAGQMQGGLSLLGMMAGLAAGGFGGGAVAGAAGAAGGNALAGAVGGVGGPVPSNLRGQTAGGGILPDGQQLPQGEAAGGESGPGGAASPGAGGGMKSLGGPGAQQAGGAGGPGGPGGPVQQGGQGAGGQRGKTEAPTDLMMPTSGPFTTRLSQRYGMDPQHLKRLLLALFDPNPPASMQSSARLAMLMERDMPIQAQTIR